MIVNHSDAGDNNCDLVDSGAPNGGASLVQGNKGQDEEQEGEQEHGDEKVGEEQDGKREVLISKDWTCVVQLPPPTG